MRPQKVGNYYMNHVYETDKITYIYNKITVYIRCFHFSIMMFPYSMARQTHFGVVDQAIKSMTQVKEYISVGMDTTMDVAIDLVEHDKGKSWIHNKTL